MKPPILATLLIALGGCSPNPRQDIAQCEMEGYKQFSANDMQEFTPAVKNFVSTCMESRGYKLNGFRHDCPKDYNDPRTAWSEMEPQCYDPPAIRLTSN